MQFFVAPVLNNISISKHSDRILSKTYQVSFIFYSLLLFKHLIYLQSLAIAACSTNLISAYSDICPLKNFQNGIQLSFLELNLFSRT